MIFVIVVQEAPTRRKRKSADPISRDPSEGYAKLDGQDENGNVKIWARMDLNKGFKLVDALPDYYQAEFFCNELKSDDRYRRKCLRQAKREGLHD